MTKQPTSFNFHAYISVSPPLQNNCLFLFLVSLVLDPLQPDGVLGESVRDLVSVPLRPVRLVRAVAVALHVVELAVGAQVAGERLKQIWNFSLDTNYREGD